KRITLVLSEPVSRFSEFLSRGQLWSSPIKAIIHSCAFPLADRAAEYRHRSAQLISAFDIGPRVRISGMTGEPFSVANWTLGQCRVRRTDVCLFAVLFPNDQEISMRFGTKLWWSSR